MERCLPECFSKLLKNGAVRRWGLEIQEGVFNMLDLLTNLVIVRLKHGPVPETLLKNVYAEVGYSSDSGRILYCRSHFNTNLLKSCIT